jgi:hypothetical protein
MTLFGRLFGVEQREFLEKARGRLVTGVDLRVKTIGYIDDAGPFYGVYLRETKKVGNKPSRVCDRLRDDFLTLIPVTQ